MKKNPYPGKFIVIDGIDGAGKSTQGEFIAEFYKNKASGAYLTAEPTNDLIGGLIRGRLSGKWQSPPECLQLLFAADRAQHLEKDVMPKLRSGVNVVCDRYFMSSLAYGSIDLSLDWLAGINSIFLKPDLTIFLDTDVGSCSRRIKENGRSVEMFESEMILEKVRENYFKIIEYYGKEMEVAIVNGNVSKEEVFCQIKVLLDGKYFSKK